MPVVLDQFLILVCHLLLMNLAQLTQRGCIAILMDLVGEPFINPQANVEKKFPDNIQSRILAKDNYSPIIPDISTIGGSFLTINDYEKHK